MARLMKMKKIPRDYQIQAIEAVINGFKTSDRGQLIMPCGSGKTFLSMWVHEKLNSSLTLVLLPSLALLRQTKNEWMDNLKVVPPYLCVCSENSIDSDTDELQLNKSEIGDNVSSDPHEISLFLKSHSKSIIFSTYQSLDKIIFATKDSNFEFDLTLCDEAHKTAAPEKGFFTLIHDNALLASKKRLYDCYPQNLGSKEKK